MFELNEKSEKEVLPKKRQIQVEEEIANTHAMKAEEMKIDCENNLQKAQPILKQAKKALDTI